jgi:hypothetical protein
MLSNIEAKIIGDVAAPPSAASSVEREEAGSALRGYTMLLVVIVCGVE